MRLGGTQVPLSPWQLRQKNMKITVFRFAFIVSAVVYFSSVHLYAGLAVTPARSEVRMIPGTEVAGKFTVRNEFQQDALIEAVFNDWFTLPENEHMPLSRWVTVNPSSFTLRPGESRDVAYTVHMPTGAAGVSVNMLSFTPTVSDGMGVTTVISVSLYVTAIGTERSSWDLENISLTKSATEFRVGAVVKNTGNIHVRPAGLVKVYTAGNVPVCAMNINEGRPVYPGASRPISAFYTNVAALKAGSYKAEIVVDGAGEQKTKTIKFKINKAGEVKIK